MQAGVPAMHVTRIDPAGTVRLTALPGDAQALSRLRHVHVWCVEVVGLNPLDRRPEEAGVVTRWRIPRYDISDFAERRHRPSPRVGCRISKHLEEYGLSEGVELSEGRPTLGPQRLRSIEHLRNPPLLLHEKNGHSQPAEKRPRHSALPRTACHPEFALAPNALLPPAMEEKALIGGIGEGSDDVKLRRTESDLAIQNSLRHLSVLETGRDFRYEQVAVQKGRVCLFYLGGQSLFGTPDAAGVRAQSRHGHEGDAIIIGKRLG